MPWHTPKREAHPRKSMNRIIKQSFLSMVFSIGMSFAPVFCVSIFCLSSQAFAQTTGGGLPDNQQSSRPPRDDNRSPAAREVTWKSLPKDFLRDQKNIWTFPVQLAKGHHWLPT